MKKIPTWLIIIIVVALLIASKFIFFSKKEQAPAGAKGGAGKAVPVNYFVTKKSSFSNNVYATGRIGALNQVDLLPEVSGKITAIYFKEGDEVNKGALLVKLNDADLQAQLMKIRMQVKLSEQKLGRLNKLLEVNGVSKEEFEMQENELSTFKADEAFVLAQIAKTNIVAPFQGVVGLKNISEGSFVNASTPIVSLVQVKPLFVEFSLPEKYNSLLRKGLPLRFSAEGSDTSRAYMATVYAIEPRVEEATRTIRARAMYNGKESLFPGSFVKVFVEMGETANAIMVPTQCVIPTLKGQKVMVSRNSVATEVEIKIGVRTEEMIQILEGLGVGDTVIATGLLSVKKDSPVKLIKQVN